MLVYAWQDEKSRYYKKVKYTLDGLLPVLRITAMYTNKDNMVVRWCKENNIPCTIVKLANALDDEKIHAYVPFKGGRRHLYDFTYDVIYADTDG